MKKALHIIRREYVESARRKAFIISTILAPLFIAAIYAVPFLAMFFVPPETVSVAVLDHSRSMAGEFVAGLSDTLESHHQQYKAMVADPMGRDPETYKEIMVQSIDAGALDVLIEIPEDVLETGRVRYISKDYFDERVMDEMRSKLSRLVVSKRLEKESLDFEKVSALTAPIALDQQKITKAGILEGGEVVGRFVVVAVFVMILYVTLISWGVTVQRSIIEEKGSRVIEVMLSSVEPKDLFIGKIIGVGSLGLTQIAVWSAMILIIGLSSAALFAQASQYIQVSVSDVVYFLLFYVLGFLLYSAIFTIVGAVCSTEQDAQQLQGVIMIPMIIPIMLTFLVVQNPGSLLGIVLSLIPLFTPMMMLARVVISDPPVWQVALSIVLLIASIYGVILFAARVFRIGILMYGKRPSLREILRWYKYA